ncbi:MAG: hypothetical protein U0Z53_26150 [Blastocatellia bacterium]
MKRFITLFSLAIISCSLLAAGCKQQPAANQSPANASSTAGQAQAPTPNAATAAAAKAAMAQRGVPGASPGASPAVPHAIPESLRRPLSREQFNQLPKETQEMILKATGGKIPGDMVSPSPGPKKK